MTDYVHEFTHTVPRRLGGEYRIRAATERRGNIWIGWLEFYSAQDGSILRTDEETSQPTRGDVVYWHLASSRFTWKGRSNARGSDELSPRVLETWRVPRRQRRGCPISLRVS